MNDPSRTNQELLEEISPLKQRIQELEQSESGRKKAEQKHDQLAAIIESAPDFVGFADARTKRISYINKAGRRMCGIGEHEDVEALRVADVHPDWTNRMFEQKIFPTASQEGIWQGECAFVDRHGKEIPVLMVLIAHKSGTGDVDFFSTISRNIAERKQAEEALRLAHDELEQRVVDRTEELMRVNNELRTEIAERKHAEMLLQESENKFKSFAEQSFVGIYLIQDGVFQYINPKFAKIFGYSVEECVGLHFRNLVFPEDLEKVEEQVRRRISREVESVQYIFRGIKKNREVIDVEIFGSTINYKGKPAAIGTMLDITERKKIDESLKDSEARYRQLFENAPAGIYEIDLTTGRILSFNDAMCVYTEYTRNELLTKNALDLLTEESQKIFIERMAGYAAGEPVPSTLEYQARSKSGREFWMSINPKYFYKEGIPVRASVVAHDITDRKKVEERLKITLENLRKSFSTTIQVMVSAVETRDPYTSGHQIRTANLARAIATEMGLSEDRIEAIRMAGPIHDIGKLSIPAEILSKPGKLSAIEFSLIKEHARKGFEMLKDVESPWPLAEIIYQHHERIDGSGYPRNLKGEEILMEALILAVADVVEAMSSHRPYRPALGINAALAEIEKNREKLYDSDVVDACLRLFREKGFQLEGA